MSKVRLKGVLTGTPVEAPRRTVRVIKVRVSKSAPVICTSDKIGSVRGTHSLLTLVSSLVGEVSVLGWN